MSESKNFPEGGSQSKNRWQNMDTYIGSATTQAIIVDNLVGAHTIHLKGAKIDIINPNFPWMLMTFLIITKQDYVLFYSQDKTNAIIVIITTSPTGHFDVVLSAI